MNITLYTTPSCPWCVRAKDYLRHKGLRYNEVNVAADMNGAMEMVRKSGQRGVPVLDINGNIVVGFDRALIDQLSR